ncbi:MAG: hypothetical protein H6812_05830 [Phycisphaeraceae bacterium]|nr:hypothetical protein [Phycisphaerales bacterium]MCB9842763.1 hypothetical protein [Phycisphaeraceae bacterium]
MRRSITLLGILAASFALPGCRSEGGIGYSADSYTYVSRTWEPKTISVIDTRTGETIWTLELPVGKQLNLKFVTGTGPNEYYPDEIQWKVVDAGNGGIANATNRLPCPPRDARRLEWVRRPVPEMPGTELTAEQTQ